MAVQHTRCTCMRQGTHPPRMKMTNNAFCTNLIHIRWAGQALLLHLCLYLHVWGYARIDPFPSSRAFVHCISGKLTADDDANDQTNANNVHRSPL